MSTTLCASAQMRVSACITIHLCSNELLGVSRMYRKISLKNTCEKKHSLQSLGGTPAEKTWFTISVNNTCTENTVHNLWEENLWNKHGSQSPWRTPGKKAQLWQGLGMIAPLEEHQTKNPDTILTRVCFLGTTKLSQGQLSVQTRLWWLYNHCTHCIH